MSPAAPTPAYRRLSVEERRAQLLQAALSLFAHRAPEEVSLDDVAEAAGVSRPLVYRYFPGGKQQMAEEVMATALGWYRVNVLEPLAEPGPPAARLAAAAQRLRAFYDGGRRACLLNMLSAPDAAASPFAATIKAAFGAIAAALEAA